MTNPSATCAILVSDDFQLTSYWSDFPLWFISKGYGIADKAYLYPKYNVLILFIICKLSYLELSILLSTSVKLSKVNVWLFNLIPVLLNSSSTFFLVIEHYKHEFL